MRTRWIFNVYDRKGNERENADTLTCTLNDTFKYILLLLSSPLDSRTNYDNLYAYKICKI